MGARNGGGARLSTANFAANLRRLTKVRHVSQRWLAMGTCFGQQAVSRWLNGAAPRLDAVYDLRAKLGVSWNELLGDPEADGLETSRRG